MERISCTILLLVSLTCCVVSSETNYNKKMYMKRSSMDQDTSATGYIYSKHGSGPAQFVYLDSDAVAAHFQSDSPSHLPLIQDADQFGTHSYVVTHTGGQSEFVPSSAASIANLYYNQYPSAAYTLEANSGPHLSSYSSAGDDHSFDADVDSGDFDTSGGHFSERYHDDGGHDHHDHHYSKGDGSEYGDEYHKKHGHEAKKAHDSEHKFEKGSKGHYDKEEHSGHYDKDGGHKKSHYDEGDEYGQHHENAHSAKGGKFGEKKHHKKGSKTTGYHNVFHKDEFKKDHTFYDDADHNGNFKKYGSDHEQFHKGSGKYGKGGHYDSSHHEAHKGKKGHFDKGYHDNDDKGYDKKHDHEYHHNDGEEFYKKHGSDGDEHHGFKESHYH